jgi:hypothetical protein
VCDGRTGWVDVRNLVLVSPESPVVLLNCKMTSQKAVRVRVCVRVRAIRYWQRERERERERPRVCVRSHAPYLLRW